VLEGPSPLGDGSATTWLAVSTAPPATLRVIALDGPSPLPPQATKMGKPVKPAAITCKYRRTEILPASVA
jgi:hypothetical protein